MDQAASSISDGDLVDALIHGYEFAPLLCTLAFTLEYVSTDRNNIGASCRFMPSVPQFDLLPFFSARVVGMEVPMPCHSHSACNKQIFIFLFVAYLRVWQVARSKFQTK